jgi:tetratricopeptide (TPR) repeat protein
MLAEIDGERAPSPEARRAAAKAVTELGLDALPAITKALDALRKQATPPVQAAMKPIRDGQAAKDNPSFDLLDKLLDSKKDGPGTKTAIHTVVLARALAHIGTTASLKEMILVAADHEKSFRPEIARLVKAAGDRGVPALIETRKAENRELRAWSSVQLEGLGKRSPGDAVQTKNNQVLSDVLRAYGVVHDPDAVPIILSFVNSDRAQVRTAAREAISAYGQDAVWKLKEAYANLTGKSAQEGWTAADVAKELFLAYDKFRLQEVYQLLEDGKAREKEGKLAEATALYDKALARQPLLDRRGEMVAGYVAYARTIEDAEAERALATFRKALRLDPEGPRARQIEAEIAYLEGRALVRSGISDVEPFRRALALDPGHAKARQELDRLENTAEERRSRTQRYVAAGALLAVTVGAIVLFGGRRRRKTSPA